MVMEAVFRSDKDYQQWISELKLRIHQSQIKAAVKVNTELLQLYWSIGADLVEKKAEARWGGGVIEQLSSDLQDEFPEIKGFSVRNLWYIKRWYLFYNQDDKKILSLYSELEKEQKLQQLVAVLQEKSVQDIDNDSVISKNKRKKTVKLQQLVAVLQGMLFRVPWGHHLQIITRCKTLKEAVFYVQETIENGWSRTMLVHSIEAKLYKAKGKILSNFKVVLPPDLGDLAQQTLKDPYSFDFLTMAPGYKEKELETALTENIMKFLLELGTGFAFVGKQYRIEVAGDEYYIDLLFYHLKLRCYVVIELKTTDFKPDFIGQLGFYVTAVNHQLKREEDNPTIGLVICKTKKDVIVEYALEGFKQPLGVSVYRLRELLKENWEGSLPLPEDIEAELKRDAKQDVLKGKRSRAGERVRKKCR